MKIIFWLLAVLSIFAGLFMSVISYISHGLGFSYTIIGDIVLIAGMFSFVACIVCVVLGILRLRKGNVKKAIVCILVALCYCVVILAGIAIDDALYSLLLDKRTAYDNEQIYGENWDAAPVIDGIPEQYQHVLNAFYAAVRDRWSGDQLMDPGAVSMASFYGDVSLESIGFSLMDLNGDNVDELVIGAVTNADQKGNAIFCIYTNPENPFYAINSVEGEVYYLHSVKTEGTYMAEFAERDMTWVIKPAEVENSFDFELREEALDPAGRMTLELTPFSQYK